MLTSERMGKHMGPDHLFDLFYLFGKGIRRIEKKKKKEKKRSELR